MHCEKQFFTLSMSAAQVNQIHFVTSKRGFGKGLQTMDEH